MCRFYVCSIKTTIMHIKRICFILLFGGFPTVATSQTLNDPIYLNVTALPESTFSDRKGSLNINFFEFNAAAPPIKLGNKIQFINGLYYRNTHLGFSEDFAYNNQYPGTLHDIRYTAVLRAQLSKRWEAVFIPRMIFRSNFSQALSSKDFFPQAVALANYSVNGNNKFKIGLGIALNNDFERNAIIPIGSLYYEGEKLKVEMVYPNTNIIYKQSEDFEWGLFATVDGSISRITPFLTKNNEQAEYLRQFQIIIAPAVSHRISKNFFGHLKIGYAPVRDLENLNGSFNPITGENMDLRGGFFVRVGVSLRIKEMKK